MFGYSIFVGIVIAIFTSLFLGVEYSDGIIRNKICIGHKRSNIYFSNLVVVILTSIFSYVLFLGVVCTLGIPLFGEPSISLFHLFMLFGCVLGAMIAYCSIFTFLAMILSSKTIMAVVSIMLAFGLLLFALSCFNILEAPPLIQESSFVNGEMKVESVPNPKYPSEEKKRVCQFLLDVNPAGQMFQIAGQSIQNLNILPFYSLGIAVAFTGMGLILFQKKELK